MIYITKQQLNKQSNVRDKFEFVYNIKEFSDNYQTIISLGTVL